MRTALRCLWLLLVSILLSGCPPAFQVGGEPEGTSKALTSGRAALVGNQAEQPGYGLYSYVLLGSPPNEGNRDRYLQVLATFVTLVPDVGRLISAGFEPKKLNVTYVLLQEPVPPKLAQKVSTPEQVAALTEWMLTHYNYARARSMLQALGGVNGEGPYLISTFQPLSAGPRDRAAYLYQDLSPVEPRCAELWVREFLDRASRPTDRNPQSADDLARRLREILARATACPAGRVDALLYVRSQ